LEGVATPDVELPPLEDDPPLHAVSNVAIAAKPNVNAKAEVRLRLIFMMSPLDKLSDNKFVFMAVCSLPCGKYLGRRTFLVSACQNLLHDLKVLVSIFKVKQLSYQRSALDTSG
jgi:hypothetical protein